MTAPQDPRSQSRRRLLKRAGLLSLASALPFSGVDVRSALGLPRFSQEGTPVELTPEDGPIVRHGDFEILPFGREPTGTPVLQTRPIIPDEYFRDTGLVRFETPEAFFLVSGLPTYYLSGIRPGSYKAFAASKNGPSHTSAILDSSQSHFVRLHISTPALNPIPAWRPSKNEVSDVNAAPILSDKLPGTGIVAPTPGGFAAMWTEEDVFYLLDAGHDPNTPVLLNEVLANLTAAS